MISGSFRLSFSTQTAMQVAARDCRSRAFTVDTSETAGVFEVLARRRDLFPASECDRYASRLRAIAAEQDGTYHGFSEDEPVAS